MTPSRFIHPGWCSIAVFYLGAMFLFTHFPASSLLAMGISFPIGIDKIIHFLMFAGLTTLSLKAVQGAMGPSRYIIVTVILVVTAGVNELTQKWVGRHTCIFDLAFNLLGIASVLFFFLATEKAAQGSSKK